jgi:methyl-accepting chemotaxis protein
VVHWTIGKKLAAGFAAIILILSTVGILSAVAMRRSSEAMDGIAHQHFPEMRLATAFESEILNARIFFIYHVTIQKPGALNAGWEHFRKARELMPQLTAQAKTSPELESLRKPTAGLAADLDAYEVSLNAILETVKNHRNKGPAFDAMIKEWAGLGGKLVTAAADLNRVSAERAGDTSRDHADRLAHGVLWTLMACAIAILGAILVSGALTRNISRMLSRSAESLEDAVREIALSSDQLASTSTSQAQSAREQAATLEQTSASFTEIGSMVLKTAENSDSVASAMAQSQTASESGIEMLERMMGAMNEVAAANKKMSNIIKVIDEIAFQTNILALNAAVEAARAGEAGLGFAVVADEVRNLAQRAASAAHDTAELITESVSKTGAGLGHIDSVARSMRTVAEDARHAKSLADELSSGSARQTQGIEQIAHAISQLGSVTERVASGADQGAQASNALASQAAAMKKIADELVEMVGAGRS